MLYFNIYVFSKAAGAEAYNSTLLNFFIELYNCKYGRADDGGCDFNKI